MEAPVAKPVPERKDADQCDRQPDPPAQRPDHPAIGLGLGEHVAQRQEQAADDEHEKDDGQ